MLSLSIHVTSFSIRVTSLRIRFTSLRIHVTSFNIRVMSFNIHVTSFNIHFTSFNIRVTSFNIRERIPDFMHPFDVTVQSQRVPDRLVSEEVDAERREQVRVVFVLVKVVLKCWIEGSFRQSALNALG